MPERRHPRHGSMQYWPRSRASSSRARVRYWNPSKGGILGFPGYKVGMRHVMIKDDRKNSLTKGSVISWPVTVLECPPVKVAGILYYSKGVDGLRQKTCVLSDSLDKYAKRVLSVKVPKVKEVSLDDVVTIRLLVHTQPASIRLKKTPEFLEVGIGGSVQEQESFARGILGKEVFVSDAFKAGSIVDVHGVTKGKGIQGPVKRFGVNIRHHKSEKTKRGPGTLGPWSGDRSWTVAHAGQMGFQLRTEYNRLIVDILSGEKLVVPGGIPHYGVTTGPCILLKGSVQGPPSRLVTLVSASRSSKQSGDGVSLINVA